MGPPASRRSQGCTMVNSEEPSNRADLDAGAASRHDTEARCPERCRVRDHAGSGANPAEAEDASELDDQSVDPSPPVRGTHGLASQATIPSARPVLVPVKGLARVPVCAVRTTSRPSAHRPPTYAPPRHSRLSSQACRLLDPRAKRPTGRSGSGSGNRDGEADESTTIAPAPRSGAERR